MSNPWKRRGFSYFSKSTFVNPDSCLRWVVTKKLGFISYHLIRLIHGEIELTRLANRPPSWPTSYKMTQDQARVE